MKMRPFLGFPYPEEAGLAPLWASGVAWDGKDEKTAPTEAVGCILTAGREGKMEMLVEVVGTMTRPHAWTLSVDIPSAE